MEKKAWRSNEGTYIESYVTIEVRRVACYSCQIVYIGTQEKVKCVNCGKEMTTLPIGTNNVVTGQWRRLAFENNDD